VRALVVVLLAACGGRDTLVTKASPTCAPSTASFTAPPWLPPRAAAPVCDAAALDTYLSSCLDAATALPFRCAQLASAEAACHACLTASAEAPGPLLARAGEVMLNTGGCVALVLGDSGPESCGAREQAAAECVSNACRSCADPACRATAAATVCRAVHDRRCAELAPAATCLLGNGFAEDFRHVAGVFCGK
jgi:hypothetical protein